MWKALTALATTVVLAGCAGLHELSSDVSTYSQWPTERKPGTYTFERLPSQQAHPEQQQALEDAARRAIEGAGFTPAADPTSADVTVSLGARITAYDRSPYDDPFWWHGGLYHSRFYRPYWRTGFGMGFAYPPTTNYEREVAVLIRDRRSGQALFEARAVNDGYTASSSLLSPMFEAAMKDFPQSGANPHRVVVQTG